MPVVGSRRMRPMTEAFLSVRGLKRYYPVHGGMFGRRIGWVKAVDGVDIDLTRGQVLGVVGESGCGKTTLVSVILRLEEPTAGSILFEGQDLAKLGRRGLRHVRRNLQIVFQDPFWSLNPRLLIRDIVGEPLKVHLKLPPDELVKRVEDLLEMVGVPRDGVYMYPHEFSGGLRQRIAIARALALDAKLVVLDEPTSAIDVLSQAQILSLLQSLKERLGLTYILISHDLSVVSALANEIAVMYLGKIVEMGPTDQVFGRPAHPYTKALFAAIPDPEKEGLEYLETLQGVVPSAINPPSGCRFHTRCPARLDICSEADPDEVRLGAGWSASCHLLSEQLALRPATHAGWSGPDRVVAPGGAR